MRVEAESLRADRHADDFVLNPGPLDMTEKKQGSSLTKADARRLLASAGDGEFCQVLADVLKRCRSEGWLTIDQVAELAETSVRTIQRKVEAEGLAFSDIVVNARAELGIELLENTDDSLKEIASALGYSTQANFSRAFKRWTGKPPGEFRNGMK